MSVDAKKIASRVSLIRKRLMERCEKRESDQGLQSTNKSAIIKNAGSCDGGPGSGNHGHSGRPGKRGGSAKGGGAVNRVQREGVWVSKRKKNDDQLLAKTAKKVAKAKDNLSKFNASNRETWEKCQQAYKSKADIPSASVAKGDRTLKNSTPEAQAIYDKVFESEKKITKDLVDIASASGTWMYGLDFSIKTASSVEDKIQRRKAKAAATGEPVSDADIVSKMGDLVRYTQLCDHDKIGTTAKKTLDALSEKGYIIVDIDNKWNVPDSTYKGFHIAAKSPDGQLFELQIHSPDSMEVKELNHVQYEVARKVGTSAYVMDTLNSEMATRTATMTTPKGMSDPLLTLNGRTDPVKLYHEKGADALSSQLQKCNVEELKGIIKARRLDPAGKSAKWKDKDKLSDLIMKKAKDRATKGEVFLNYVD